jgi:hypothetical protein
MQNNMSNQIDTNIDNYSIGDLLTILELDTPNKENVLDVLNEHITQLRKFKASLEKENWDYLRELIEHANEIKRILKAIFI